MVYLMIILIVIMMMMIMVVITTMMIIAIIMEKKMMMMIDQLYIGIINHHSIHPGCSVSNSTQLCRGAPNF